MKNIIAKNNPIRTKLDWEEMRSEALKNPGLFHGKIAQSMIYWFNSEQNAWIKYDRDQAWIGFDAKNGKSVEINDLPHNYTPWKNAFDDSEAPFYKWFSGAKTNACFNEVDAPVLEGFEDEIAFIFEGDRWDSSLHNGKGGPVIETKVTRKELLCKVAARSKVLLDCGLKTGDRIALNMPNILEQIYFIEAAKRLGIIYTCVFGGFSAKTLSDRIHDAGAKIVITTDGAYRNAEIINFKENYTDKALDNYVSSKWSIDCVEKVLKESNKLSKDEISLIMDYCKNAIENEITVERSEVMLGIGAGLQCIGSINPSLKSKLRTDIAEALTLSPKRVEKVIVVQHAHINDLNWYDDRDMWAHELIEMTMANFIIDNKGLVNEKQLLSLPLHELIDTIYRVVPPIPVDAEFPLFIIYTSGSTGKPKGVVHTHGGYVSGVSYTMLVSFDINVSAKRTAEECETILVLADPGWITGQSYMITAALVTRTTSVIVEGSPLFPHTGRFASIIQRHKVNIFKAGSTFLKTIASDLENIVDVNKYDVSSLKVATFCAEPTNPAIQEFAMGLLTDNYINSYWATEHGGIILTHFFGNADFPLQPDAHAFPLPWIFTDVWVPECDYDTGKSSTYDYHIAKIGEKGEIVITHPYPYLARTIWGDAENVGKNTWRGDFSRYKSIYFQHFAKPGTNGKETELVYTQGDYACKYSDGSISLHGRSDDVINTSGHRIGTEEIERAILKDKQLNPNSIVGNAIVVGAPHRDKGTIPVAFIITKDHCPLKIDDEQRLNALVREEKGIVAIPGGYIVVPQLPETRSGKYIRRLLQRMLENKELGDTSSLRNPECLPSIKNGIHEWNIKQQLNDDKFLLTYSTLRVEIHEVEDQKNIAILTISRPPLNTLDERTLDDLNTVLDHLSHREDIKVIIITGSGAKSFIAGADVKQLLEDMHASEDVIALPHQANQAISIIEKMKKPVIAAINGVALGGGNEFQMACHYRIAEFTAEFAQPEINLHILPGYGGTQRLPRLLAAHNTSKDELSAIVKAAEIVLSGRHYTSKEALEIGLINEIVAQNSDVITRAVELAKDYIVNNKSILKKAHRDRLELIKIWEQPKTFPTEEFETHKKIIELEEQANCAGRALPFQWTVEALRYGYQHGLSKGIEYESYLFSKAVVHPNAGKIGIRAFLDKRSAALPTKDMSIISWTAEHEQELLKEHDLIPIGTPFYPGFTKIPRYQYAFLVEKDSKTGDVLHGEPITSEKKRIIPVEEPNANEALLYMLTSEINFNDIWAITGVPVSPFDSHDKDWHVTGSGGLALVAQVGDELKREGRIRVGDLVVTFSGVSDLLDPVAGLDPMFAEQHIQGYELPNGSHEQFMIAQGPQIHDKVPDLNLETAGSFLLNLGTIYRALFNTLHIKSGKTIFIEGSATGTGAEAVSVSISNQLKVIGLVSSEERAQQVLSRGASGVINRTDPSLKDIFTKVPLEQELWDSWENQGQKLIELFKEQNNGRLADYSVSHAGELSFPRSFQLLDEGGIITFYGASSGYHFTFMGKPGHIKPTEMLRRVELTAGDAVLIFYGLDSTNIIDEIGLESIEAAVTLKSKVCVCTITETQSDFVKSMGYGEHLRGVFSLEKLKYKEKDRFVWPETMPPLPDPKIATAEFQEKVRWYQEYVFKPFAAEVGKVLRSQDNPRGYPDLIIERAHNDTLALSSMLVKPYTGKVAYVEDMSHRRYSFYAPQVWMRQRRIYLPTVGIFGSHLSNAYEIQKMNELINAGFLSAIEPHVVDESDLMNAHQEIWENKHRGANYVLNHALPRLGLKTKDDLYHAWSMMRKNSNIIKDK